MNVLNDSKYLGLTIDNKLNFNVHVGKIANKISKTIGVMYKLRKLAPDYVLLQLYYTLIYPYLIYANLVWGGTHEVYLKGLKLLQKKVVRIICNSDYLAHTDPLFFSLNILKISDIHTYLLAIYAFKSINSFQSHQHSYNTRNRDDLVPAFQRISLTQNAISYSVPSVWNSLPLYIRKSSSLSIFKRELKFYLLRTYCNIWYLLCFLEDTCMFKILIVLIFMYKLQFLFLSLPAGLFLCACLRASEWLVWCFSAAFDHIYLNCFILFWTLF